MIIESKEGMREVAKKALSYLRDTEDKADKHPGARILLLRGDLGAGKTSFVQELAQELGVTERVTSPTFVIQKEYRTRDADFSRLVHIDAYRLESFSDLELLGWENYSKDPSTIIAIEWPEKVEGQEIINGVDISFAHIEGGREVFLDC